MNENAIAVKLLFDRNMRKIVIKKIRYFGFHRKFALTGYEKVVDTVKSSVKPSKSPYPSNV